MHYMQFLFPQMPENVYTFRQEFADVPPSECPNGNFLKGIKLSPDGACLLTASDDNWLRLYDLPADALTTVSQGPVGPCVPAGSPDAYSVALRAQEGETIYDYAWYPHMTASEPSTCCWASTSRGHPIHVFDALDGSLRAVYKGYNDVDEPTAALSLAFTPDGSRIYAGYNRCFRVFDVSRPGRDCKRVNTHVKRGAGLPGIVSAIAFSPDSTQPTFALGSYSGVVGLFDGHTNEMQCLLHGHKGGITQVLFSRDGNYLYSGARQDPHVLCWDVRYTSGEVYRLERDTAHTNQRIAFDIEPCGRHLVSGGCHGRLRVFDLRTGAAVDEIAVAADTVNGCAFHPVLPLLAVATGERRYPLAPADDAEDEEELRATPTPGHSIIQHSSCSAALEAQHEQAAAELCAGPLGKATGASSHDQHMATCSSGAGVGEAGTTPLTNALRVLRLAFDWVAFEADEGHAPGSDSGTAGGAATEQVPCISHDSLPADAGRAEAATTGWPNGHHEPQVDVAVAQQPPLDFSAATEQVHGPDAVMLDAHHQSQDVAAGQ